MSSRVVAAIIVIIVILGGAYLFWGHTSMSSSSNNSTMSMPSQTQVKQNSQPTSATSVSIQNFAFSPSAIKVTKGTKVTWTNMDSTDHTVTETDSLSGPSSGNLGEGQSYSFTFNSPGTYHYHCSIHSEMTGTVSVTQ